MVVVLSASDHYKIWYKTVRTLVAMHKAAKKIVVMHVW